MRNGGCPVLPSPNAAWSAHKVAQAGAHKASEAKIRNHGRYLEQCQKNIWLVEAKHSFTFFIHVGGNNSTLINMRWRLSIGSMLVYKKT